MIKHRQMRHTAAVWKGNICRNDGLTVEELPTGYWAIRPNDGWVEAINCCPCCMESIRSKRDAKRIADTFYPPLRGKPSLQNDPMAIFTARVVEFLAEPNDDWGDLLKALDRCR